MRHVQKDERTMGSQYFFVDQNGWRHYCIAADVAPQERVNGGGVEYLVNESDTMKNLWEVADKDNVHLFYEFS